MTLWRPGEHCTGGERDGLCLVERGFLFIIIFEQLKSIYENFSGSTQLFSHDGADNTIIITFKNVANISIHIHDITCNTINVSRPTHCG